MNEETMDKLLGKYFFWLVIFLIVAIPSITISWGWVFIVLGIYLIFKFSFLRWLLLIAIALPLGYWLLIYLMSFDFLVYLIGLLFVGFIIYSIYKEYFGSPSLSFETLNEKREKKAKMFPPKESECCKSIMKLIALSKKEIKLGIAQNNIDTTLIDSKIKEAHEAIESDNIGKMINSYNELEKVYLALSKYNQLKDNLSFIYNYMKINLKDEYIVYLTFIIFLLPLGLIVVFPDSRFLKGFASLFYIIAFPAILYYSLKNHYDNER